MKKTILNMLGQLLADFLEQAGFAHRKQTVGDGLRSPKEKQRIVEGVRKFFDENYELRYNVMKQAEEFRPRRQQEPVFCQQEPVNFQKEPDNFQKEAPNFGKGAPAGQGMPPWKPLTDRELRQMAIEQMEQVGVAWSIDVELYVRSALVPFYNPVSEFLDGCGQWDGRTNYIRQMARRVPTITALTAALKAGHFSRGKVKGVRGWYARQLRETENGSANRCDTDT